jgi:hypothetical protein
MTTPHFIGDWSIKDLLAHLGFWEEWITGGYHTLLKGEKPVLKNLPIDEINAGIFAERHALTLEAVRTDERKAYQALLSLVETAPEADLFNPQRFAWAGGHSFAELIGNNSFEHFDEHVRDLIA